MLPCDVHGTTLESSLVCREGVERRRLAWKFFWKRDDDATEPTVPNLVRGMMDVALMQLTLDSPYLNATRERSLQGSVLKHMACETMAESMMTCTGAVPSETK